MNNDGWGFLGAGTDDRRVAGADLQHHTQKRTADELHMPVRIVTQPRESGGPMKHHLTHADEAKGGHHSHEHHHGHHAEHMHSGHHSSHHSHHKGHHHPMHHHLEEEKMRHEHAMDHHRHHLERHHGRHYDTQHGHDHYKG